MGNLQTESEGAIADLKDSEYSLVLDQLHNFNRGIKDSIDRHFKESDRIQKGIQKDLAEIHELCKQVKDNYENIKIKHLQEENENLKKEINSLKREIDKLLENY